MTGAIENTIARVFPKTTDCFSWKNKVFYWEKKYVLVGKTAEAIER